jgi:hypothetical protein
MAVPEAATATVRAAATAALRLRHQRPSRPRPSPPRARRRPEAVQAGADSAVRTARLTACLTGPGGGAASTAGSLRVAVGAAVAVALLRVAVPAWLGLGDRRLGQPRWSRSCSVRAPGAARSFPHRPRCTEFQGPQTQSRPVPWTKAPIWPPYGPHLHSHRYATDECHVLTPGIRCNRPPRRALPAIGPS